MGLRPTKTNEDAGGHSSRINDLAATFKGADGDCISQLLTVSAPLRHFQQDPAGKAGRLVTLKHDPARFGKRQASLQRSVIQREAF